VPPPRTTFVGRSFHLQNLTEATVPAWQWLQLEAGQAVTEHIQSWLTSHVTEPLPW